MRKLRIACESCSISWKHPPLVAQPKVDLLWTHVLFFGAENPNYISEQARPACAGGQVRIPGTRVDEHMIVERGDGSLWMLLRNSGGIAQSVSTDGGRTWSDGSLYLQGRMFRNKRFFLRRLKSGALLMVRTPGVFVLRCNSDFGAEKQNMRPQ